MAIKKEEYVAFQANKDQQDFRVDTVSKLNALQNDLDLLNEHLRNHIARQGSDHVEHDQDISKVMDSCMESLKEFRMRLELQEEAAIRSETFCDVFHEEVKKNYIPRKEYEEEITFLKGCIERLHSDYVQVRTYFTSLLSTARKDFDEKLAHAKSDILSRPSEIPALKALFEEKLELVTLNGTNSVLRSSNCEKQIMLLERKIEQVMLMIKKIDIARQEA